MIDLQGQSYVSFPIFVSSIEQCLGLNKKSTIKQVWSAMFQLFPYSCNSKTHLLQKPKEKVPSTNKSEYYKTLVEST